MYATSIHLCLHTSTHYHFTYANHSLADNNGRLSFKELFNLLHDLGAPNNRVAMEEAYAALGGDSNESKKEQAGITQEVFLQATHTSSVLDLTDKTNRSSHHPITHIIQLTN